MPEKTKTEALLPDAIENPEEVLLDLTEEPLPTAEERRQDFRLGTAALFLCLLLLLLPSLFPSLASAATLFRVLAYLLPAALVVGRMRGAALSYLRFPKKREFLAALPLLPLFLLAVITVASLTVLLFPAVGGNAAAEPLGWTLLFHALLPSFLEEMLFRLALFSLFFRHTRETAVYLSAFFFAILHTPAAMPYALIGGFFLGAAVLITRSVWVSLLFHFLNNAASLLLSHVAEKAKLAPPIAVGIFFALLLAAAAVGIVFLVRHRHDEVYRPLCTLFHGGHRARLTSAAASPLALATLALLLFSLL